MTTSAFVLFGELKADTKGFQKSLREADTALQKTKASIEGVEDASHRLVSIGDGLASVGKAFTAAITVPLAALGTASAKAALDFDVLRTQLAAATGDTASASAKFKELNALAQSNAGVMTAGAVATYAFLKPLGFMDGTINETIKAFGKLKAANPEVDLQRMATNLAQLFDQGFEMQDVKELFGNFPRAGEILKQAFGLSGSDRSTVANEMKAAMANGLSREDFFAAFASGINNDAFLSKVTDPITVKFAKTAEQIKLAFEPLGLIILTALLAITPYVTSFIQMVSSGFESLGPTMQMAAVAFGAIATAIGPVIFGVGKLVAMLGGMGVTASGLGVAVLAAFGLMLQAVLPIIAMAALFGQAWYRNWDLVKQTFEAGVSAVSGVLASGLEILQSFWEQHGNSIMSYLSAWWNTLAEFVGGVMDIVSGALTVALMVIQGNWTGAWDAILQLTQTVWATITQFITNALSTVGSLIQAYLPIFIQGFKWAMTTLMELVGKAIGYVVYFIATLPQQLIRLVPQIITAAGQIGAAIWAGIKQGFAGGGGGTGAINNPGGPIDLFGNVIDSFKSLFNTSMPKSTIPSASSPAKTFLSPIKMEAIQTSKALDDVKNKMNQVKATAKPILKASTPAAAQPRSVYGKAVEVFDVTRRNDMESWEAALLRVMSKQAEGRLAIDIKDDTGRTQIGGTSANVAARYR